MEVGLTTGLVNTEFWGKIGGCGGHFSHNAAVEAQFSLSATTLNLYVFRNVFSEKVKQCPPTPDSQHSAAQHLRRRANPRGRPRCNQRDAANGRSVSVHRATDSPVSLLEAEFAATMGSRYALAVSSCFAAALFLSLKALALPRGARVLIPAFTFAAVPSSVIHADTRAGLMRSGRRLPHRHDRVRGAAGQRGRCRSSATCADIPPTCDAIVALCDARSIPVVERLRPTRWARRGMGVISARSGALAASHSSPTSC